MSTKIIAATALLGATLFSACGGDEDEVAPFLGTWKPTMARIEIECEGMKESEALTDTATFKRGTDSDLVDDTSVPTCPFKLDVKGKVATAKAGQTCVITEMGVTSTQKVTTHTLTLSADGKTATDAGSGTFTFAQAGKMLVCPYTTSGTYAKQP